MKTLRHSILLRPDTRAYYHMVANQYGAREFADLNENGEILLAHVRNRVDIGDFTATLTAADSPVIISARSGAWEPDPTSPYFQDSDLTCLCTSQNRQLVTNTFRSSAIIFHQPSTDQPGWVYTLSGSLYRVSGELILSAE